MTDPNTPGPAAMDVRPVKRSLLRRLSLVWIVPILALAISLYAAWQNYADRGTLITISFENAAGITAGETSIKYRDVTVGAVEKVEFAPGLGEVLVYARVEKNVAPYLDDDAQFWVVRPDVSVRGITGLDTVLSGVYIEGNWDTEADVAQTDFFGLETPVLTRAGQRGTRITLRAADGSTVSAGSPVLHKGIEVGYLEKPELNFDGTEVIVSAFIESPYDRRVTSSTRFWDTSGFSVSFGAGGVSLDVNSLASLIEGGVAFDTVVSGGDPIEEGHIFSIFDDEQTARDSLFTDPDAEVLNVAVLFEQSVSGLTVGSEVRFQGIRVGEVSEISAIVVGEGETAQVRLQTVLAIEPARLGLPESSTTDDAIALLSDFVARGMRARMVTGNILSGTLMIQLVEIEDALPAIMTITEGPYPVIPSTESQISDVAATAEGVLARINALPVEELMDGAIDLMDSIERLANDESTRLAPEALVALLDEGRALIANDDLQSVPRDLRDMIAELDAIVSRATELDLVGDIDGIIGTASEAADNIAEATRNLPEISAQIEALAAKANALELDALVASVGSTLDSIDALIASDDTMDLPGALNGSLEEMRLFLAEVREGGAIENVNAALASANEAAQAIEEAVVGLPDLSTRANRLVAEMQAVIASYGERSRFSAETMATLRDIQSAADSLTALARTIQRNPSSLLTGR
ncbi:PqiB family protein [Loktanella sp. S4079]|uniref:PqiB family protein n=1 Tax=Loktanella sp. S4079 TaxID=579483 RepID=UPI0005FA20A5|nr:MlaD family protein [Loktanella sp. S4079]